VNSADLAVFSKVCGHKYIDLSEYGYGVAMLNDCKYGFAVAGMSKLCVKRDQADEVHAPGNTMRISLVRSATGPGKQSISLLSSLALD
jgi:alpha-mannosidase